MQNMNTRPNGGNATKMGAEEAVKYGVLSPEMEADTFTEVADVLFSRASTYESANINNYREDCEFLYGDQWDYNVRQERNENRRPALQMNILKPLVMNTVSQLLQSMPGIKFSSIGEGEHMAHLLNTATSLVRYSLNKPESMSVLKGCCERQVAFGISHCRVSVDEIPGKPPGNAEVKLQPLQDGYSVLWQPLVAGIDKQSANYVFVQESMDISSFCAAYPHVNLDDVRSSASYTSHTTGISNGNGRSFNSWNSSSYNSTNSIVLDTVDIREAIYKHHFYTTWLIPDADPTAPIRLDDKDRVEVQRIIAEFPGRKQVKQDYNIHGCIYIPGTNMILESYDYPLKTFPIFTFVGLEADVNQNQKRFGVVALGKDAQRMYNFYKSSQMEILGKQTHTPWMALTESISGLEEWDDNANRKAYDVLRYNRTENGDNVPPVRVPPPMSSDGIFRETKQAESDLNKSTGIYDSAMGATTQSDASGRAIQERGSQVSTTQYIYKDHFNQTFLAVAQHVMELIPHIYTKTRLLPLMHHDGTSQVGEVPPLTELIDAEILVDVGPNWKSTRAEQAHMLQVLASQAPDLAPILLEEILLSSDLTNRHAIVDKLREHTGKPSMADEAKAEKDMASADKTRAEAEKARAEARGFGQGNPTTNVKLNPLS